MIFFFSIIFFFLGLEDLNRAYKALDLSYKGYFNGSHLGICEMSLNGILESGSVSSPPCLIPRSDYQRKQKKGKNCEVFQLLIIRANIKKINLTDYEKSLCSFLQKNGHY